MSELKCKHCGGVIAKSRFKTHEWFHIYGGFYPCYPHYEKSTQAEPNYFNDYLKELEYELERYISS